MKCKPSPGLHNQIPSSNNWVGVLLTLSKLPLWFDLSHPFEFVPKFNSLLLVRICSLAVSLVTQYRDFSRGKKRIDHGWDSGAHLPLLQPYYMFRQKARQMSAWHNYIQSQCKDANTHPGSWKCFNTCVVKVYQHWDSPNMSPRIRNGGQTYCHRQWAPLHIFTVQRQNISAIACTLQRAKLALALTAIYYSHWLLRVNTCGLLNKH